MAPTWTLLGNKFTSFLVIKKYPNKVAYFAISILLNEIDLPFLNLEQQSRNTELKATNRLCWDKSDDCQINR